MLSINTNLSSLSVQNNLKQSTNSLNQAIERMTTGAKLNHAKDNAANYSINTSLSTKINALQVAESNVGMGLDMVQTASNIISTMQDHATRLQALSIQARNGTYDMPSVSAITSEATAIVAEIARLYTTAEYNGISLFNRTEQGINPRFDNLKSQNNGFIDNPVTYSDAKVATLTRVADVDTYTSGQTYSISSKEELIKLAEKVNSSESTSGVTFVLASDIDLSSIDNWTLIGKYSAEFKGVFDGNGHVIKNLTIKNSSLDYAGLFGRISGGSIKNVGIEDCEITANFYAGGLAGYTSSFVIINSYVTGNVYSNRSIGGLVGRASSTLISYSYTNGKTSGMLEVGGLVGYALSSSLITNSYANENVNGKSASGGLVGFAYSSSINNCYTTGSVTGTADSIGGLVGKAVTLNNPVIADCASYSTVSGNNLDLTGSFIGGICTNEMPTITGSESLKQDMNTIGGAFYYNTQNGNVTFVENYDMSDILTGIKDCISIPVSTILYIGINSDDFCQLTFDTNFSFDISAITTDIASDIVLNQITDFLNLLSNKQTELGAVENRLNSALESIAIAYDNLVSTRSTIRDADVAEESSVMIRSQILQQAAATLMATANQSPSIALQLL